MAMKEHGIELVSLCLCWMFLGVLLMALVLVVEPVLHVAVRPLCLLPRGVWYVWDYLLHDLAPKAPRYKKFVLQS